MTATPAWIPPGGWTASLEGPDASWGRWRGYLFAAFAVGLAALAQQILQEWLGPDSPNLLLALAVFAACLFAGPQSGMLAALLSSLLILLLARTDGIVPHEWSQFFLFWMTAIAVILITLLAARRIERAKRLELAGQAIQVRSDALSQELNLLIDSASNYAIVMLDPEGRVVIWNKGAERTFGWTEAEILGQPHSIFFTAAEIDTRAPENHLGHAREHGKQDIRGWRVRKDGSEFLASVTLAAIHGPSGNTIGFGKVVRDVTDEESHRRAIEARETHLRSILSTVPDAMVVIDEQGLIEMFSPAAERLFGYTEAQAIGQNVSLLMASPDRETHDDYMVRYRATGKSRMIGNARRVIGRRKDGTTFPHELAVGEALVGGSRVFTGFVRDLTAREEAESRLKELQAELLRVSRATAMGTMASTLAHELNQPLTAVANYVQTSHTLLLDADDTPSAIVREALAHAGAEALRAGSIIRRLRNFVAHGEVSKSIVQISQLVEDASLLAFAGASERGIVRLLDLDPALGPVLVDPVQIQQVMINLISNAIEAMRPHNGGEIRISTCSDGEFVRFTITDTGPGIAPEIADSLFQAFVSTKHDGRGMGMGMGMGLSICRTIVEAHDGTIWTESPLAGGAMFHFTVPLAVLEDDHA